MINKRLISFLVGNSPIIFQRKCRLHQMDSTLLLESYGQVAYMKIDPEPTSRAQLYHMILRFDRWRRWLGIEDWYVNFPLDCWSSLWIGNFACNGAQRTNLRLLEDAKFIDIMVWDELEPYIQEGDIVVNTFVKSGTTWMIQVLLQMLNNGEETLFAPNNTIHNVVPWVENTSLLPKATPWSRKGHLTAAELSSRTSNAMNSFSTPRYGMY